MMRRSPVNRETAVPAAIQTAARRRPGLDVAVGALPVLVPGGPPEPAVAAGPTPRPGPTPPPADSGVPSASPAGDAAWAGRRAPRRRLARVTTQSLRPPEPRPRAGAACAAGARTARCGPTR